jgi:hypothetical protein
MGNYLSDRVGNYVSVTPLQLGNFVSADRMHSPLRFEALQEPPDEAD